MEETRLRRQPLFNINQIQLIANMAAIGLSNRDISHILGINESTLYRRFQEYPQLEDAMNEARANQKKNVLSMMHLEARQGNVKAGIWILERIHGMLPGNFGRPIEKPDDLEAKSLEEIEAEFSEITECIETTLEMTKAAGTQSSESKLDDSEKLAKT